MTATAAMIEVVRLTFAYGGRPALFEDFTLTVGQGEAWAVIGPSGCGKSTLLFLLAGLRRPQSGEIRIFGEPLRRPRPRTGLILQDHGLLPWATLRENARLGARIRNFYGPDGRHAPQEGVDRATALARVDGWLERLGILEYADQYPSQLSRGQRQRAAIARTLSLEPDLLLMDEPFSALDAPTRTDLLEVIGRAGPAAGLTRVLVTHDIEEAVLFGQKILVLGRGVNREAMVLGGRPAEGQAERDAEARAALRERLLSLLETKP
jgi:NitT/TauT family transport system ATP-binding protein